MQITSGFLPTPLYADPIIEALLANRPKSFQGVSQSDELERQNRLHGMLKASKKYKRIAIENANQRWNSFFDDLKMSFDSGVTEEMLTSEITTTQSEIKSGFSTTIQSLDTSREPKRVSFSDTIDIIPVDYKAQKGISAVKRFFSSLITSRLK